MSHRRAELLRIGCLLLASILPRLQTASAGEKAPFSPPASLRLAAHHGVVGALAFSPDGTLLAAGYGDGDVVVWDVATGRARHTFPIKTSGSVEQLQFLEGGKVIAALPRDNVLRLWSLTTGKALPAPKPEFLRYALAASPDGKTLALYRYAEDDNPLVLWRPAKGPDALTTLGKHDNVITGMAFSRDGKTLLSADRVGQYHLWDLARGRSIRSGRIPGKWFRLSACGFLPGDKPVIAWYGGGPGTLLDVASGKSVPVTVKDDHYIGAAVFSRSGQWLALGGSGSGRVDKSGIILLWDVVRRREVLPLRTEEAPVLVVAFAPSGQALAAGDRLGTVHVWKGPLTVSATKLRGDTLRGDTGTVHAMLYAPDGRTLASAAGSTVQLWNTTDSRPRATLKGHTADVRALAFAPDGKTLASGGCDHTVRLWDPATEKARSTFTEDGVVLGLAFAPDGALLAAGLSDGRVRLRNLRTGKVRPPLAGHNGPVHAVAFSPDGRLLASGSSDHIVKLWDAATGGDLADLDARGAVRGVAFSRDGKMLVVAAANGALTVWDVKDRRRLTLRTDGGRLLWGMALAPDGRTLATVSLEGRVAVWDLRAGGALHERTHWSYGVLLRCVAFTPDGKGLATAGNDRAITIWKWLAVK